MGNHLFLYNQNWAHQNNIMNHRMSRYCNFYLLILYGRFHNLGRDNVTATEIPCSLPDREEESSFRLWGSPTSFIICSISFLTWSFSSPLRRAKNHRCSSTVSLSRHNQALLLYMYRYSGKLLIRVLNTCSDLNRFHMTNWTCHFYVQQSKLTKLHIKFCYLKIS